MRLKLIATVVATAAVLIGMTAAPAQATHGWGPYHWPTTDSVARLTIYSSLTPDWEPQLNQANSDWIAGTHLSNTVAYTDNSLGTRQACPFIGGAIRVCNDLYGANGWAGLATINLRDSVHISQGIAQMNDTYENNAGPAEWQGVMCQEVGHLFGLGHQDETFGNPNLGTCMDYTSDWSTNQSPNQHDYDQLDVQYNHADGFTAPAQTSSAGVTRIQTGSAITMVTWAN